MANLKRSHSVAGVKSFKFHATAAHFNRKKLPPPIITPLRLVSKLLLLSQCSICLQIRIDAGDKKEHLFKHMGTVDLLCRCLSGRSWTNKNFAWYISPYTTVNPKPYTTSKTKTSLEEHERTFSGSSFCFALPDEEDRRLQKEKCMHSANGETERRDVVPRRVAAREDWRRARNISTLCSWCNTPPTTNAWTTRALRPCRLMSTRDWWEADHRICHRSRVDRLQGLREEASYSAVGRRPKP